MPEGDLMDKIKKLSTLGKEIKKLKVSRSEVNLIITRGKVWGCYVAGAYLNRAGRQLRKKVVAVLKPEFSKDSREPSIWCHIQTRNYRGKVDDEEKF